MGVHTTSLSRSDRSALRARERALHLLGLRELLPGLHVRPDNLRGGIDGVRTRLRALGVSAEAAVFGLTGLDAALRQRAETLWDGDLLSTGYRQQRTQLERWLARAPQLALAVAAREAFTMGDAAIRGLVFDPMLPDPLVDVAARAALTDTVLRYDRMGHGYWQQLAELQRVPDGGAGTDSRGASV